MSVRSVQREHTCMCKKNGIEICDDFSRIIFLRLSAYVNEIYCLSTCIGAKIFQKIQSNIKNEAFVY